MSHALSSAASYLASFWKAEHSKTVHTFSKESDSLLLATTQSATRALNQQISDLLPGCTLRKAMLRETKQGELSFHSEAGEAIVFSNEKTMDQWLADKTTVDIWQIEDQRPGSSGVFYKLQRANAYGYDTFETRDELFNQLKEEFGVFWKLEDQGKNQPSYIHYKPGIFGCHYVDVNHEDLIFVANSLKLESPHLPASTPHASGRASRGKSIAACVLGGLLLSAGRSWSQSFGQNSVSDAITTLKGTLGPVAFKTASTFAAIAAVSRQESGALSGTLLAGIIFLAEPVKGQSLCPQLVGNYDTPGDADDVTISGTYAYVTDGVSGFQIINVSNVTNPTLAGSYDTPGEAYGVAISGNYAYVGDGSSGLQIIDVSNVVNLTLAGFYDTLVQAWDVAISGNYAYVADGNSGLRVIDVSNVANPTLEGSYNTPGYTRGVALSGNYAYVADDDFGLQIIDVSIVSNPTLAGFYDTPVIRAWNVAVSGNYAYVADNWNGALWIIDVSNVANPTLASFYNTTGYARCVAVSGNYAYVADAGSGLQIIDVSNVTNPILAGSYNTNLANGVTVFGNYAYVTDGTSGLQIISTLCPTSSSSTSFSSSTTSSSLSSSSSTTQQQSSSMLSSTIAKSHSLSSLPLTTVSSPNNSSIIWIGLGIGVVLCLGLAGGIVYIIQKRKEEADVEEQALGPITNVSFYNPSGKHETLEEENPYGFSEDVKEKSDRDSQYQRTPDRVKAEGDQHYQHTPVRESQE
ncbi:MAG: hypothetical protein K940chlam7_00789 [Chlamydiae bacterium]|nr:hypothetical protein [Chlamydiota bacterium]